MKMVRFALIAALVATVAVATAACSKAAPRLPPAGSAEPDKYLFDHGNDALAKKKWLEAREYFRNLVERYPQSAYRPDAKLALGDTYIGENSAESRVLAINEFTEFLSFFPTNPRADYAQFKIAYAHYKQMLGPARDQTETREAVSLFQAFLTRFPTSTLKPEAEKYYREARDRLSDSEYNVGLFYTRISWCPGAIDRFTTLLKDDPKYTNRDAVYFYMAECYVKAKQPALAAPYYDRITKEFTQSEFIEKAKKRLSEIKVPAGGATTSGTSRR